MRTRNATREAGTARARSTARAAALGAALALLAGCSDDGGTPSMGSAPETGDADVPIGGGQDETLPTEDPPGLAEQTPLETDSSSGTDLEGGTVPGENPSGTDLDDRERLIVEVEPGTPIGDTASPWLVFIDMVSFASSPSDSGFARVNLIRYDEPKEFESHVDFYDEEYLDAPDTCFVRDLNGGGGGGEGDAPRRVDGGETLLLTTSDGGSWGEIPRFVEPGNVYYDADGTLPGTAPADLLLTIPGDVFPAVTDYPLLTPAPPVRVSPAFEEPLTTESVYEWEPGDGRGYVKLDFLAEADDGEFLGFPVTCYVRDDGEFEPTAEAVDALLDAPGEITLRYSRVAARIELRDGVAFFLVNEIAE